MPAFQLTFNGVPFCLDTPEVIEFVERNIPLKDLRETILPDNPTTGSWAANLSGIAIPHHPPRAELDIGRFFYPTGLARWGQFHGLMKSSQLNQISGSLYQSNGAPSPLPFVIRSDAPGLSTGGITTPMYMLPPRYLGGWGSSVNSGGKNPFDELWLVTLVDERYYNTYKSAGKIMPDGNLTWDQLIQTLVAVLGITLNPGLPPIEAAYGKPSQDSPLWSMYESAAYLLQACAENVGRLVIRNYDGTYSMPRITDVMTSFLQAPLSPSLMKLAGGDEFFGAFRASRPNLEIPSQINVTFPKFVAGIGYVDERDPADKDKPSYGDVWIETVSLGQAGGPWSSYSGVGIKTLHDTARACYQSYPGYNCCQAVAGVGSQCCYQSNGSITFVTSGPCPSGGAPGPCPPPGSVCCFNSDGSFALLAGSACPAGTVAGNCPTSTSSVYAPANVPCPFGTLPTPLGQNCPTIPAGSGCCFYPDGTFITITQGFCPQGTQPGACPQQIVVQDTTGTPSNELDLRALAVRLAQNYLASLIVGFDIVFPGIVGSTPDGLHDLIFTYRGDAQMASTRLMRKPWNYGAVEFQHDFWQCTSVSGNCCLFSDGSTVMVPANWPCPPGGAPVSTSQCQPTSTGSATGTTCQQCCKSVSLGAPGVVLVGCGQPCPNGYSPAPAADCQGAFAQQQCCQSISLGAPGTVIVPLGQHCPDGYTPAPMSKCQANLPSPTGTGAATCFNFTDSCTVGWNNGFTTQGGCLNVIANFKGIYVGGVDAAGLSPGNLSNYCGSNCDGSFVPPQALLANPPTPAIQCCSIPGGGFFYIPGGAGCPAGTTPLDCNAPGVPVFQPGATCCYYNQGSPYAGGFVWTFGQCPPGTTPGECPNPNNPIPGASMGIDELLFDTCDFNVSKAAGICLGGAKIRTQGLNFDIPIIGADCLQHLICVRDGLIKQYV